MNLDDDAFEALLHRTHAGQYVNSATHDLNNVLGAIMAYADLIKMDSKDPETTRMAGEIVAASEKGAKLLEALTMIARPVNIGRSETASVSDVFSAIELLFAYDIKRQGVDATFTIDSEVHQLFMEDHMLQRILMRLIDNAMDALDDTPQKTLRVESTRDGASVQIVVSDSGTGVPDEVAQTLFDPQVSTKDGHIGMGLTLARQLATACGATLEYDKGSRFILTARHCDA
ncbi:MAG: HAMP domain-containing sensor histidine kinase [Candidatus Hydrogenedentota bacterium]